MNIKSIIEKVENISACRGDFEVAHCLEDELYFDFIKHVAKRNDKIGKMAREVIKTEEIDFARHCA